VAVADVQWKAILLLSMNAALANTDVAEIQWKHIGLTKKLMIFPRPKTGRIRKTPLAPEIVKALRAWKKKAKATRPENSVFLTWQGTKWVTATDSITKHWNLLRKKVDGEIAATFKALRKTASSTAMASGISQAELATDMLLGHCPNKTWRYYVGFAPEFLTDAVEAIRAKFFTDGP
jgi:integrase